MVGFLWKAEEWIRVVVRCCGVGDVYKRRVEYVCGTCVWKCVWSMCVEMCVGHVCGTCVWNMCVCANVCGACVWTCVWDMCVDMCVDHVCAHVSGTWVWNVYVDDVGVFKSGWSM